MSGIKCACGGKAHSHLYGAWRCQSCLKYLDAVVKDARFKPR